MLLAVALVALPMAGLAQLHSGTADGGTVAVKPSAANGAAASPNTATVFQGANRNAGLVNTGVDGSKLGYMDIRQIDAWGRAIYHSDGSYTVSTSPKALNSMIQETFSPNGVILQRRVISLDGQGRPSEVLIYDGRGLFRFRGEILYDNQGRFREERIFDAQNQLIRRRIQKYLPNGQPGDFQIVDDLSKVPPDLKLVITQQDGYNAEVAQRNQDEFWRQAQERERGSANSDKPAEPKKEKKRGFLRFFGGGKD
ncbi:MAG: hypothetical protein KDN19_06360 [Verrucomicrobiae bacterium]|nr:hypothetical protein [Verrucomicrobiae bacterium]